MRIPSTLILLFLVAGVLAGCDPVVRHKISSTIFDGVPSLPPADEFCKEFQEKTVKEQQAALLAGKAAPSGPTGSDHPPYAEKRCERCHDKSKDSGLIAPKEKLCFICHPTIISKPMIHGPASVGACLECHEPHSSPHPSLLKADRKTVCAGCHQERRMAEAMHAKVTSKEMTCMDCHDPHAGNVNYFLR